MHFLFTRAVLLTTFMAVVAHASFTFDTRRGPKFTVDYDKTKAMFKFEASVPNNMWLAIALGHGMTNTDMVIFRATGDGIV